jgi:hypothetical protein
LEFADVRAQILLVLLALAVTPACVGNKAYRTQTPVLHETLQTRQFDPTQDDDAEWPFTMAFIEFDDRGEMFSRTQLERATAEIAAAKTVAAQQSGEIRKRIAAAGLDLCERRPELCVANPVVVVFVHGWKNNASEGSGNVWGFRQVLAGLSMQFTLGLQEEIRSAVSSPDRLDLRGLSVPVVGVYIGWRGAVVKVPILKEFTFFDRHVKSQNVPNAHMVEALLKVMQAAKGRDYQEPTISVLIGHSFGGAVLETAITQPLMSMLLHSISDRAPVTWPATLTMLLNEAQEATRSYQLIEALHANLPDPGPCPTPSPAQRPVIVSITSSADYATRAFFPAAQSLSRPFNSLRTYETENFLGFRRQTPMFLGTTAHLGAFHSHVMGPADDPDVVQAVARCRPLVTTTIGTTTYHIVEKPEAKNRTPYWVMHMPPALVPDHSTIFTASFVNLLTTMIYQVTTPPQATGP